MTDHHPPEVPDLSCVELVELLTDYLDDSLPVGVRASVEEHLVGCEGCQTALSQWRTVIRLAGRLTEDDLGGLDPLARDELASMLRRLRRR